MIRGFLRPLHIPVFKLLAHVSNAVGVFPYLFQLFCVRYGDYILHSRIVHSLLKVHNKAVNRALSLNFKKIDNATPLLLGGRGIRYCVLGIRA